LPGVVSVDNQIKVEPPAPEHSDDMIAFKVRTRLLMKANVSAANTKVDVKDGVVTLSGTADNVAQKELTEVYAREIEGVKRVNNNLAVAKAIVPERTMGDALDDASITAQVKYALLTHQSTSALNTKIATKDGAVVIGGEAANDAERDLVTKLVQSVRGVKSVQNDMTLKRSE
jgi:osmotically-inducible protein OsmY